MEILNEAPISMAEVKGELAKIKKRDKELGFRSNKTEEYLTQLLLSKKSKELYNALVKLNIPRLKEPHMIKIVDLLPKSIKELKAILQGYTVTLNNANMEKIIETVKKSS